MSQEINDSIDFEQDPLSDQYANVMGNEGSSGRVVYDVPRGTDLSAAHTLASLHGPVGDGISSSAMSRPYPDEQPSWNQQDPISRLEQQQTQFFDHLIAKLDSWQASTKEMVFSQIGQQLQSQSHQQIDENNKLILKIKAQVQNGIVKSQQLTERFIKEDLNPRADLAREDREMFRQTLFGNQDHLEQEMTQQTKILANIKEFQNRTSHKVDATGDTLRQSIESLTIAVTTMSESVTSSQEKLMDRWDRFENTIMDSVATMQTRHHHDMDSISNRLEQHLQKHEEIQQNITQVGRNLERIMYDYTRPYQGVGMDGCFQPHGSFQAEPNNQGAENSQYKELPSRRPNKAKEPSYISKRKGKGSKKYDSSSSSSSSESDSDSDDSDGSIRTGRLGRTTYRNHRSPKSKHKSLKSNPFDGSEKWKVWYERFKVGTKQWKTDEKLDAMLQLMKGKAADFVFDQLPKETLRNYQALKAELKNRYRKVENPETYAVMFANRSQHATETVQDFAAELTMLYDKAHPHRDAKTRREDLMRRWLDGVRDKKAAKQVEFVKTPKTMEEAIDAFIKLQGLNSNSNPNKASKVANFYESDDPGNDNQLATQDVRFIKSSGGAAFQSQNNPQGFNNQKQKQGGNYNSNFQRLQYNRPSQNNSPQDQGQRYNQQSFGQQSQQTFGSPRRYNSYQQGNQNVQSYGGYNQQNSSPARRDFTCFKCGGLNHMAKNCLVQVAPAQPRYSTPPSMATGGLSLFGGQLHQPSAGFSALDDGNQQPPVQQPMYMYQMAPPPLSPSYQAPNSNTWNSTIPKVIDDGTLPAQNTQQVASAPVSSPSPVN